jgi:hypothetical protein
VPTIPPKKSIGNKDLIFIQQRRFYLEKFFRSISKFGFLINSQEFRVFSRPNGMPIDKAFERMPPMTPAQIYERIKEATGVDDTSYSYSEKD